LVELIFFHWFGTVDEGEEIIKKQGPLTEREEEHKHDPAKEVHHRDRENWEFDCDN
jgi:hypothetical protein